MSASSSATSTRCGLAARCGESVADPVMGAIVAVAGRMSDRWAILYGGKPRAPVSQLAEETDSKPVQCEFESHRGHSDCGSVNAGRCFFQVCWMAVSPPRATFAHSFR